LLNAYLSRMNWSCHLRSTLACAVLVCLTGSTCNVGSSLGTRNPPVIIPAGSTANSFDMRFSVDLRDYPDAAMVSWIFGDGGSSPTMNLDHGRMIEHTFNSSGTFTIQVHVFDGGDPINHTPATLIGTGMLPIDVLGPNAIPTASFTVTDVSGAPLSKTLNASASKDKDGSIKSFSWDFGDGQTGEGMSIQHDYSVGGQYDVVLTVTDNRGATATATKSVSATVPPTASFTATVQSDGLTVSFDAAGSTDSDGSIVQYSWDFGDSSTGTGIQPTHVYQTAGTYNVVLTVKDDTGATATSQQSVHAAGIALLVRSASPSFGVVDTTVDVTIDGENFLATSMNVRLLHDNNAVNSSSYDFVSSTRIIGHFDLHGAALMDYDVVVGLGSGTAPGRLVNGFRVGTANRVRLKTTKGDMLFELVDTAPITTQNFIQYVQDKFYDGTIIHRVVPNFVIQGGGFLPGMVPAPGVRAPIQNEFDPRRSNVRGTVAMAKLDGDPNSATSQWFVNLADNSSNLDNQNGGFTVFANVIEGMDIADAIAAVPLNGDAPVTDIIVTTARRE